MNVDSSTVAISTPSTSNTQSSRNTNSSTDSKGFAEELKETSNSSTKKAESTTDKKTDKTKDNKSADLSKQSDGDDKNEFQQKDSQSLLLQNQNLFNSQMANTNENNGNLILDKTLTSEVILTKNIQELVNAKNQIATTALKENAPLSLDYNSINMSDDDAMFFVNLIENTDMTMQTIAGQIQNEIQNNTEGIEQKVQISAVLMETIKEGMKTNQPFRIDFGQDVSVILKLDKDGSVSANFIPGDKAVEQYLKNNIGFLKQRFNEENLSYRDLSYSQSKNQNQERNQQRKDKEKE